MLARLLPEFIKRPIRAHIRTIADSQLARLYFPSHPGEDAYCIGVKDRTTELPESGNLPIPPRELWLGYGSDAQTYIASGKQHVTDMIRILEEGGFSVSSAKRIMEFGCAAGRMIRHLAEFAPHSELLGVDISGEHIRWCIENLTPTIHFANTTILPHLPFEDRCFDLVFCGSVFTHIEDIQEAWLLELGRLLRPTGRLYVTIHDEHTVKLLDSQYHDHWFAKAMRKHSVYYSNQKKFNMIVIGRGTASQVFYHSNYFRLIVPPCFRWVSLTPEAYGYQSAVVLEKLAFDRAT